MKKIIIGFVFTLTVVFQPVVYGWDARFKTFTGWDALVDDVESHDRVLDSHETSWRDATVHRDWDDFWSMF